MFSTITRLFGNQTAREVAVQAELGQIHLSSVSSEFRDNPEVVIAAMSSGDVRAIRYASHRLLHDEDFITGVLKRYPAALEYIPKEYLGNADIVGNAIALAPKLLASLKELQWVLDNETLMKAIIKRDSKWYLQASKRLQEDKSFALTNMRFIYHLFPQLPRSLQEDSEIFLSAIEGDATILQFGTQEQRDDEYFVKVALIKHGSALKFASLRLRTDREFLLSIIPHSGYSGSLSNIACELHNDKEIVLCAARHFWDISCAPAHLLTDHEIVASYNQVPYYERDWDLSVQAEVVRALPDTFMSLPLAIQIERTILMSLLSSDTLQESCCENVKLACSYFPNDKEIFCAAGGFFPEVIQFAGETLRNDKEFVMKVVRGDGVQLEHASDRLKNDRDVVWAAVTSRKRSIEFASLTLRDDKEICLLAASGEGNILPFLSKRLQQDIDILLQTFSSNQWKLKSNYDYIPSHILNDKNFLQKALVANQNLLERSDLRYDKAFVLSVIEITYGNIFKYLPEELQDDEEIINAIARVNGNALECAHSKWFSSKELVLSAVKSSRMCLRFLPSEWVDDRDVALAASGECESFGKVFSLLSKRLQEDREIVLGFVMAESCLQFVHSEYQNDKEIVLRAVSRNGEELQFASSSLTNDRDIVMAAVNQCKNASHYISDELCGDVEIMSAIARQDIHLALDIASDTLTTNLEFAKEILGHHGFETPFFTATTKLQFLQLSRQKSARK